VGIVLKVRVSLNLWNFVEGIEVEVVDRNIVGEREVDWGWGGDRKCWDCYCWYWCWYC
jgi:hypothetical protein